MGKVYRYIDTRDNFIKYIGIVYGENRTLEQRHREHIKNEIWCDENFKVQYLDIPVHNRSEAESLEAHFISLYKTGGWYNKSKSNWGQSSFIPEFDESEWQNFNYNLTSQDLENIKNKRINLNKNTNDSDLTNEKLNALSEKLDVLIETNRNSFESINRAIMYGDFSNIKETIKDQIQEMFSNEIDLITKKSEILRQRNEYVIDKINNSYSELASIEEKIKNSIQETFSNKIDLITKKFEILRQRNEYVIDKINNSYSELDSIEEKIKNSIQEMFSNEIGNIREEINNKFDLITKRLKSLRRWCIFLAIMSFILLCGTTNKGK